MANGSQATHSPALSRPRVIAAIWGLRRADACGQSPVNCLRPVRSAVSTPGASIHNWSMPLWDTTAIIYNVCDQPAAGIVTADIRLTHRWAAYLE